MEGGDGAFWKSLTKVLLSECALFRRDTRCCSAPYGVRVCGPSTKASNLLLRELSLPLIYCLTAGMGSFLYVKELVGLELWSEVYIHPWV